MMRPLLTLALSGALALPAAAVAQDVPVADPTPLAVPPVAPEPDHLTIPVQPEAAPARAEMKPSLDGSQPTTVAPVLVEGKDAPKSTVGQKVGTVAGGVVGGIAGAAVAGPVGKFAGAFVGKRVVKAVVGDGKKDGPQIRAAQTAPSADQAAAETADLAAAPPLRETVADPEAPTP
jgi:phage-related minor tail protein